MRRKMAGRSTPVGPPGIQRRLLRARPWPDRPASMLLERQDTCKGECDGRARWAEAARGMRAGPDRRAPVLHRCYLFQGRGSKRQAPERRQADQVHYHPGQGLPAKPQEGKPCVGEGDRSVVQEGRGWWPWMRCSPGAMPLVGAPGRGVPREHRPGAVPGRKARSRPPRPARPLARRPEAPRKRPWRGSR